MTKHYFGIAQQKHPPTHHPWRIIETVWTSDGPRTRICDGSWATEEEACKEYTKKELEASLTTEQKKS